jgi:predicted transcriptional regulator
VHAAEDAGGGPAWPLGPLEERILQLVWQSGTVTVRRVHDTLLRERRIAYTTVMTVMGRLTDKGLLRRVADGGTYRYSATFSRDEYGAMVTQRLARELVARFGDLALAQFVAELERVDPERRRRLSELAERDAAQ